MTIVDAQVHAWHDGQSTGHHRRSPIDAPVLQAEMASAGVDRVVLVPPLWDPGANAYSLSLAQAEPARYAVMGVLDPELPDAPERLRHWRDTPGMRAVRFLLNTPQRIAPLLQGKMEALWPEAERQGLTVALLVPGGLAHVDRIAGEHPGLRIIVDHLGVPRGASGPAAFDHLAQLLALARHPNVHVKAAGVGDYALDPYPFRSLDTPLRQVFEAFGAERVIWASDLSRLHHAYAQCVRHFSQLSWLEDEQRDKVMGGNILRLIDWS